MLITEPQKKMFWREWKKTCLANQWTKENGWNSERVNGRRKELLRECGFNSLTEVDKMAGFTRVINSVIALQGTSLKAASKASDPSVNETLVLRTKILTEIVPCLELYSDDVQGMVTGILEDKNRWWKVDRPTRRMTLMDIDARPVISTDRKTGQPRESASALHQMLFTLSARLNTLRRDAGDTVHQMKIKAGVPCFCTTCKPRRLPTLVLAPQTDEPAPVEEPY